MSVYKVAFCPRISLITLIFFREISVISGQIFFLFDFVDRHSLMTKKRKIIGTRNFKEKKSVILQERKIVKIIKNQCYLLFIFF